MKALGDKFGPIDQKVELATLRFVCVTPKESLALGKLRYIVNPIWGTEASDHVSLNPLGQSILYVCGGVWLSIIETSSMVVPDVVLFCWFCL